MCHIRYVTHPRLGGETGKDMAYCHDVALQQKRAVDIPTVHNYLINSYERVISAIHALLQIFVNL